MVSVICGQLPRWPFKQALQERQEWKARRTTSLGCKALVFNVISNFANDTNAFMAKQNRIASSRHAALLNNKVLDYSLAMGLS